MKSTHFVFATIFSLVIATFLLTPIESADEQCGWQADGALCGPGYCCSNWGFCGTTPDYCDPDKCQLQCTSPPPPSPSPPPPSPPPPPPPPSRDDLTNIISLTMFEHFFPGRNTYLCPANGFYNYEAFLTAARYFPDFGATGNMEQRRREVAAFLAQTGFATYGPVVGNNYGLCIKREYNTTLASYCVPNDVWPCAPGVKYYGRGPMQLRYNTKYGPCGVAIGEDLLQNPDLLENDAVISFKSALWLWMTPQPPKPSSHDVMVGNWVPTPEDVAANRVPGFGATTNIINGGVECGHGHDDYVLFRIRFYERFCSDLGVAVGQNIDCYNQRPFEDDTQLYLDQ